MRDYQKAARLAPLGVCAVMWTLIGAAPAWAGGTGSSPCFAFGCGTGGDGNGDGGGGAGYNSWDNGNPGDATTGAGGTGGDGGGSIPGPAGGPGGLAGGAVTFNVGVSGTIAGGVGTPGTPGGVGSGGGGGGGGGGLVIGSGLTVTATGWVSGGSGGAGGAAIIGSGGGGGGGGAGLLLGAGTALTNIGSISGGTGGAGGDGNNNGGGGGGGDGILATGGGTLVNSGTISGGNGGADGVGDYAGSGGGGGAGVTGADLSITNSGTISGGLSGDGLTRADAITFTGGANRLTLQSGATLIGNIGNNGTSLTLDQSDDYTLANVITGNGSLTKTGTGTLTLSGANTYTGGTTLSGGTLSLGSDTALGTGTLTIGAGATLRAEVSGWDSRIIANNIVVNGDFNIHPGNTFMGVSSFRLTGAIDLAGGNRTITNTMDWLNGDTYGEIGLDGPISNGGLILATPSISAAFTMKGTQANTYTGDTVIGSGVGLTLQKSNGVTAIAGNIIIQDHGSLGTDADEQIADTSVVTVNGAGVFNVGVYNDVTETIGSLFGDGQVSLYYVTVGSTLKVGAGSFSGVISGDGSIVKQGPGTLILNGANTYTGATTVAGGTLEIGDENHLGASAASDVTVDTAGTLAGHGTVMGDVGNVAGGVVSPGGSIGTLHVGGNYTQGSTSSLRIQVGPNGASRLAVGGSASLHGTLNLVFTPGVYHRTSYTIVSAAGGLGGSTFGAVTQNGGGVYGGVSYGLNNVMLGVNNGSIGGFSVAPTNGQVIGATSVSMVQGAQASNRALFGHLSDRRGGGSNDDNLRTAFAGSNPNQVAFGGDLAGLNAVLASLPEALAQQGGWFRATGGFGSIDGSGGVPGVYSHGGGFMAGYDYQLTDHVLLGAAVGYSRTQVEQDDGSSSTINTPRVTVYGSYQLGSFALDGSLGYGYDRIKTDNVSDGGVASSQHDAHEIVAGLQASYAVDLPQKVALTPRAGLDYLHLFEEGFKESGATGFDLTSESGDMDSLRPFVGVSVSREFVTDGGTKLTPQLDLTYSREVLDNGRNAQVLVGGGAFTVAGVKPSRDQLILGVSLTASLTQSFDLFGGYTALLPVGNTISHNFEAGLRVTF